MPTTPFSTRRAQLHATTLIILVAACGVLTLLPFHGRVARAAVEDGTKEEFPMPYALRWDHEHPWRINGRVTDLSGAPIPDAPVAIAAEFYRMDVLPLGKVLAQVRTDAAGHFQISTPKLSWTQCQRLTVTASAPHRAVVAKSLDVASIEHEVEFRLEPETVVRGQLSGPDGRPAPRTQVILRSIYEVDSTSSDSSAHFLPVDARPLAWPAPAVTDDMGRFTLRNIRLRPGAKVNLALEIDDPRFAPEWFEATLSHEGEEVSHQCLPVALVTGTVIRQDTGAPLPNAWLLIVSTTHDFSRGADTQGQGIKARTDGNGRFRARLRPGRFVTGYVYPPAGEPYPAWMEQQPWPDGNAAEFKIAVPRGVLVRGKVVDEETKSGVAGAGVEYHPRMDFKNPRHPGRNPYVNDDVCRQVYWATERQRALTDRDGRFEIAVLPGRGYLMVKSPTPEFMSRTVTFGELQWDMRKAFYYCLEGLLPLNPKPTSEPLVEEIVLRRGATVSGSVVGPQGEQVESAVLLSPSYSVLNINPPNVLPIPVRDGRFQLSGYNPDAPQLVSIWDAKNNWGTATVINKESTSPQSQTIRLSPCGSAAVTLVDQQNRPWKNHPLSGGDDQPLLRVMVAGLDGAPHDDHFLSSNPYDIGWYMDELARDRYRNLKTDEHGRVTLPGIIPGAKYKLFAFAFGEGRQMWREAKVFQVEPGRQSDLGTIAVRRSSDR